MSTLFCFKYKHLKILATNLDEWVLYMELDIYLLEKDNEIPQKKKQLLKREKS